jgi:hypothetical protein
MTKHRRGAHGDQRAALSGVDDAPRGELAAAVEVLLGSSLGVNLPRGRFPERLSAILAGLSAGLLYACVPVLQYAIGSPGVLILLSCWGTLYFGVVVALTRSTSRWAIESVATLIVPTLSDTAARMALDTIRSDFQRQRFVVVSLATSLVLAGLSWWLLRPVMRPQHLAVWSVGYTFLYFTAALVTLTTRFHLCFSAAIKQHPEQLFQLDPAHSPVILALSALGNRLLRYWFYVFLLVVTLAGVPPVASRLQLEHADTLPTFVFAVIAVAGFFSFVFGSLVYLRFENDLRNAVDRVRLSALDELQREYTERFQAAAALQDSDQARINQLKGACDLLSTGGLTRTAGRAAVAMLVTILPAVAGIFAAVVSLWSGGKK